MSSQCRKTIIDYSCKLFIVATFIYIHRGRLSMIFIYYTDTFYVLLTDYIYYIYRLCQPVLGKYNWLFM